MQRKPSHLRLKMALSLAVAAGVATSTAVLLYRADTARGQESPEEGQFDLPPDQPVMEEDFAQEQLPIPEELPDRRPEQLPENFERPDEDDIRELIEAATSQPATAPTSGPATAPGVVLEEPEPARRADRPRGTRLDLRGRRPGAETAPSATANGAEATRPGPTVTRIGSATRIATAAQQDAAPRAATTQSGALVVPANGHAGGVLLNFQDASIDAVLDELSSVAGFIVVKEVSRIDGKVTLVSKQPVTPEEAVSLLNTVLKRNNYAAVRQGRVLKVMPLTAARKSAIPVMSGADPTAIEPTDELITQVIPIRNAVATQLKEDLEPLINEETSDFSANASSNSLILTDTAANIRRIVQVVSALDTQMAASVDVSVHQLKFASASATAKLITDVFGAQAQSSGSDRDRGGSPSNPFSAFFSRGRDGDRGSDRDRGRDGRSGSSSQQDTGSSAKGRVTASADDRTNTVVVTGPPDTLDVIAGVIEQIDSDPTAERSVFVYSLRNANAAQLELVINNLFNGGGGVGSGVSRNQIGRSGSTYGASSGRGSTGGGGRSSGGFGGGGSSGGFGSSRLGGSSSGGFGGFGGGGFFGSGGFGGSSSSPSRSSQAAAADLAGQVTVVAEADTNSLLVMTSPKNFERVKQVVEELDRAVPQVLIKVLIAEVTHDTTLDVGTEFSVLNLHADSNGETGQIFGSDFGLAQATGGLTVRLLETDVQATLRALERNGKLDVLSRPYILASDNQLASITVGQDIPIPSNTRVLEDGSTTSSIDYRPVGILLDVVPHINPDGLVIMDVQPEISSPTDSTVQISEQYNAPIFNTRSALSRVAIENGKTIVIGGLMQDRKNETLRKIPLLGDIPVLGAAFRRIERTKTKTELLIFLTPHVASSPDILPGMTDDELNGTKLTPNAVEPGMYEEHRKGLQRGATTVQPRGGARPHVTGPATTQPAK